MMTLKIKDKEYKVKFGYNSFCDTDLMERTSTLLSVIRGADAVTDDDVFGMGRIKDLFDCVRELLYVGFQKYNPVENAQVIGDLLDDYNDEGTEENPHGILDLFTQLTEELFNAGFLSDILTGAEEQPKPKISRKK